VRISTARAPTSIPLRSHDPDADPATRQGRLHRRDTRATQLNAPTHINVTTHNPGHNQAQSTSYIITRGTNKRARAREKTPPPNTHGAPTERGPRAANARRPLVGASMPDAHTDPGYIPSLSAPDPFGRPPRCHIFGAAMPRLALSGPRPSEALTSHQSLKPPLSLSASLPPPPSPSQGETQRKCGAAALFVVLVTCQRASDHAI
jgi:hypothetical protein